MKNTRQVTGELKIVERMPSSAYGNPRFLCLVGDTVCRTKPDSSLGYSIENHRGDQITATIGEHYGVTSIESIEEVK